MSPKDVAPGVGADGPEPSGSGADTDKSGLTVRAEFLLTEEKEQSPHRPIYSDEDHRSRESCWLAGESLPELQRPDEEQRGVGALRGFTSGDLLAAAAARGCSWWQGAFAGGREGQQLHGERETKGGGGHRLQPTRGEGSPGLLDAVS
ncbi:glutamine dumper 1 [Striga asiatica]|uniref:Glutamine dumper 1 n=1 Tax=Striga asiatica TaxID=4170 RepID=A0A5A7QNB3_STRAF|nr:glutamine dumper 1 [Striga asiatica]